MELKMIETEKIRPATWQPRRNFPKEGIDELGQSIKGVGLIEPIVVRKKGNIYEIIAGERRYRAMEQDGFKEIPCAVRKDDDTDAKIISLVENWQRAAVETIDNEKFIAKLYDEGTKAKKWKSFGEMGRKTGIPINTISQIIESIKFRKDSSISGDSITWRDISRTAPLKESPEVRKKLLEEREKDTFSAMELETDIVPTLRQLPNKEAQLEEIDRIIERKEIAVEIEKRERNIDREIAQGLREPEHILEDEPDKIRFLALQNTCSTLLKFTPSNINVYKNEKYKDEAISILKKTEDHIHKLLIAIGETKVV